MLRAIHIYDGSRSEIIDYKNITGYITELVPHIRIDIRDESLLIPKVEESARLFARVRVKDVFRGIDSAPALQEIDYEYRRLREKNNKIHGILYEGLLVADFLNKNIPPEENNMEHLHIYITNQLMASFDHGDRRFHARYAIFSYPCIISTTGVVVAPAKPREYYVLKQRLGNLAVDEIFDTIIKERMKGKFIDYDDERINDVMKGLILQCMFFHVTGNPFCDKKDCRLFNAHWQEDLIRSQVGNRASLCEEHLDFLRKNFD